MKKKFVLMVLFLWIKIICFAQYHTERVFLQHEGLDRYYEVFIPENYSAKREYPVVLILHGGGGTAKGLVKFLRGRFNFLAERDSFIAVYPNGFEKSWNDGARDTFGVARKMNINDVGFISALLSDLSFKVSVDKNHIFACGISNGGFMVQRLAFELSDKIKGIGVIAANLSEVQDAKKFNGKPVPVIFINGTDDPLVPYNGGHVTVLQQNRGKILSVEESILAWQKINGCSNKSSEIIFPDKNRTDGSTAVKAVYSNPENKNLKVVAIKVQGGGHTWPGTSQYLPKRLIGSVNRDFNGCDEIWNFFKSLIN